MLKNRKVAVEVRPDLTGAVRQEGDEWRFTDVYGNVWRLIPTGLRTCPIIIELWEEA